MIGGYDLHIHTISSDGTLTPADVVDKAVKVGLKGIAITDHDTVAGLEAAQKYVQDSSGPFEFIPGIELNTEAGNEEIHILGYFIDSQNHALNRHLQMIRDARYIRVEKMVDQLQQAGLQIDLVQVTRLARGESIGRPHVARALVENGYVTSIKEAFAQYIGRGRPGFVPRYKFMPGEAIELIKNAGGIAVLAHPGLIKNPQKIIEIIELGVEGLEVYYPEHSLEQQKEFAVLADKYRLLQTGGSDYHGPGSDESRACIGSSTISSELLERMHYHLASRQEDF